MPRLIGESIILREYRQEDFSEIRKWVNDAHTTRYLSSLFWAPQTMADTQDFLDRMLRSSHNACNFVIARKEDEAYLGQLDMFRQDWRLRCGELGIVIAQEDQRGQGIGCQALKLMLKYGFHTLGMERIELEVYMDNHLARRCYEKAGFVLEGVKRHAFFLNGTFVDVGIMSVLRHEWDAMQRMNG